MWSPYLRGKALRVNITVTCSIGFILFGYDQGVMGGVLGGEPFIKQFNNPSPLQQGLITGLYDVGCLLGSLLAFVFSEKHGRRKSILAGAVVSLVGAVLQTTAKGIPHLIVARILTGVGVGIMTANVPIWQSEVSQAHNRGILLTIQAANVNSGFVLSTWITFGTAYVTKSQFQWIFPIALQVIFPIYLLLTVPFLVESPRWVAHHRSLEEATQIIARLRGLPGHHSEVTQTRQEIQLALEEEKGGSFKDVFRNAGQQNFRRMMLGVIVMSMQQLTGINSVAYYVPVILKEYLGVSNVMSHVAAAVGSTQCLCFSFVPILFIERIGRRTCLLWGAALMAIVMSVICIGYNVEGRGGAILVAVMYFVFYDFFTMSYLEVPWMYAAEINSLKTRSRGMALASTSNWLLNGVVVTVTPIALRQVGWKYYLVWAILNASFFPVIYFLFPETGGRSLEEIDHIFEGQGKGWSGLTQGVRESVKRPRPAGLSADSESGHAAVELDRGDQKFPTLSEIERVG